MTMTNNNKGKCGHARCAGGNGCLQKGAPMRSYTEISQEMKDWERLGELENKIIEEKWQEMGFELEDEAETYLTDEEQAEYRDLRAKLLDN